MISFFQHNSTMAQVDCTLYLTVKKTEVQRGQTSHASKVTQLVPETQISMSESRAHAKTFGDSLMGNLMRVSELTRTS